MELKDVFAMLEKVENGAEAITTIKSETNRLNNEAKGHRLANEKSTGRIKDLLASLGLEDGDDVLDKVKEMKTTLDGFAHDGKTPDDVAKEMAKMAKDIKSVTDQLKDMTAKAEAEKTKRFEAMKTSALVDALTKGNAAAPQAMAKLIADKLAVGDDEKLTYKDGDKDYSVDDGVKSWLAANPWAVKATGGQGGGSGSGGSGENNDPFLDGFDLK